MNWIPCDNELPNGAEDEVACLVTCQEWDLFDGKWGDKEVRILSYSIKKHQIRYSCISVDATTNTI